MNLFQRIFGQSKVNGTSNNIESSEENAPDAIISEDDFVDRIPPKQEDLKEASTPNQISTFLEEDFAFQGRRDGYEYHSSVLLENKIKSIKARFRFVLDKEIDEKGKLLQGLFDSRVSAEKISSVLAEQIDTQISRLNKAIKRYETEISLSAEDEGWVMQAIHNYRDGFIRGFEEYNRREVFETESGLFN